jgi:hypothetical protein
MEILGNNKFSGSLRRAKVVWRCHGMALALAEEIAVLKNEIALYECHSEAAKVNGDLEMQRLLLATITARSNNLLYLEKRLEKQGNRNQSAMSRGIKGTPFSSFIEVYLEQSSASSLRSKFVLSCFFSSLSLGGSVK